MGGHRPALALRAGEGGEGGVALPHRPEEAQRRPLLAEGGQRGLGRPLPPGGMAGGALPPEDPRAQLLRRGRLLLLPPGRRTPEALPLEPRDLLGEDPVAVQVALDEEGAARLLPRDLHEGGRERRRQEGEERSRRAQPPGLARPATVEVRPQPRLDEEGRPHDRREALVLRAGGEREGPPDRARRPGPGRRGPPPPQGPDEAQAPGGVPLAHGGGEPRRRREGDRARGPEHEGGKRRGMEEGVPQGAGLEPPARIEGERLENGEHGRARPDPRGGEDPRREVGGAPPPAAPPARGIAGEGRRPREEAEPPRPQRGAEGGRQALRRPGAQHQLPEPGPRPRREGRPQEQPQHPAGAPARELAPPGVQAPGGEVAGDEHEQRATRGQRGARPEEVVERGEEGALDDGRDLGVGEKHGGLLGWRRPGARG